MMYIIKNKLCLWNTNAPHNGNFLKERDLNIWHWQMTLTLVPKKRSYHKESSITYHSKIMAYEKVFCKQPDRQTRQKLYAPNLSTDRHKITIWNAILIELLYITMQYFFNSLPHNPDFQRPWKRSLLKTLCEKERMLVTNIFSSFPQCFLSFLKRISNFKSYLCWCLKMLSVWTSLKLCCLVKS